ncbi:hypothetical protein K466DRAFT_587101 [Polyporus arcularius HHB13444]|uniref:Uncharacterized protein n=1 Tax=Polyporus arcularius HHB13444 TaxID=1314778 RepID=A0A5C3PBG8_9APHY|nr:hypothetical protein K466DRAFT_587101 [Polyporus arcularius HHB13444]
MGSISTIIGDTPPRLPALKRIPLIPRSANADMEVRTTASALSRMTPLMHLRLSHIHIHGHEQLDVLGCTLGVPRHRVSVDAEEDGTPAQRDRAHATLPRIREVVWHTVIPYQSGRLWQRAHCLWARDSGFESLRIELQRRPWSERVRHRAAAAQLPLEGAAV